MWRATLAARYTYQQHGHVILPWYFHLCGFPKTWQPVIPCPCTACFSKSSSSVLPLHAALTQRDSWQEQGGRLDLAYSEGVAAQWEMVGGFSSLCCITEWNRTLLSLRTSQRTSKQPDAFLPVCWLLRSVCNGVGQFLWAGAKMVLW